MGTKAIIGLLSCVCLLLCLYSVPPANAGSAEDDVMQMITTFNKAFNTCDLGLMSSLWWHSPKTSEYVPTTGYPFIGQGWEQIEEWWKGTFEFPKGTIIVSLYHPQVLMLDNNVAVITGYNNVIVNPPAVKEQSLGQIRQTVVAQKIDGRWLIVHYHASDFPANK